MSKNGQHQNATNSICSSLTIHRVYGSDNEYFQSQSPQMNSIEGSPQIGSSARKLAAFHCFMTLT